MSLLARLSDTQAAVATAVRGAVVRLHGERVGRNGHGSGVHLGGGLIVTCAHVVAPDAFSRRRRREKADPVCAGGRVVRVRARDGQTSTGRVVTTDAPTDLALVSLDEPETDLPLLVLARDDPRPGTSVMAIGHPGGGIPTVSHGVVMHVHAAGRLVTDAHLRPGHSGGPLVDARGHVVGICATLSVPDLGGAAPVSAVWTLLDETGLSV